MRTIAEKNKGQSEMLKQAATETAGDGIAWALLALGITFHAVEFIGGLFYALAAAMLTRHWFPELDKREVWATLLAAFLVSTIGAGVYNGFYNGEHPVPIQFVMAGFGFASRAAVRTIMGVVRGVESRTDQIAERLIDRVLPDDEKDHKP